MAFKLIKDKNELEGTCYFEFLPGEFKNKCWNDNSVFISEDALSPIEDLLKKSNENYDHYAFVYFNKDQVKTLVNELSKRLSAIREDQNYKITGMYFIDEYYSELNRNIKGFKDEIIKMIEELTLWIKSIEEKGITVLGI